MATATVKPSLRRLGPRSSGIVMTPRDFDRAEFERGYRYELINGVLVVSPPPLENQRDPNEELGYWLRGYRDGHPYGSALDLTLPEHTVRTGRNRRTADRAVWTGLGRLPRRRDVPTIVVEFVSAGKRNFQRDYVTKRDEYLGCGVREYWVIDRFAHTLTVFRPHCRRSHKQVVRGNETHRTDLLPGFERPLGRLFALADRWPEEEED
jgi:Uma2 family endonuclease